METQPAQTNSNTLKEYDKRKTRKKFHNKLTSNEKFLECSEKTSRQGFSHDELNPLPYGETKKKHLKPYVWG